MAVIDWWNGPLTLVVIFFELCLLLLTFSIAGVACRDCHSSDTFFHCDTHTHTHTHTYTHMLLTWSIAGVTCCACHSSGTFFHCDTHTHTHKHMGACTCVHAHVFKHNAHVFIHNCSLALICFCVTFFPKIDLFNCTLVLCNRSLHPSTSENHGHCLLAVCDKKKSICPHLRPRFHFAVFLFYSLLWPSVRSKWKALRLDLLGVGSEVYIHIFYKDC